MKNLIKLSLVSILFVLASCGADKMKPTATTSKNVSGLTGGECSCNSLYAPVCGPNGISYDNICIANCKGVPTKNTVQGNCECSEALMVCGDDNQTYTECDARNAILNGTIRKIEKFAPCGSAQL